MPDQAHGVSVRSPFDTCGHCGREHLGGCALTLRQRVEEAHHAVQAAQHIAYRLDTRGRPCTGWWTRWSLNKAQNLLIKLLVHSEDLR